METTTAKVLKRNVLEFLNSSMVLDGLHGTVEVAEVSEGSPRDSVLVLKYNRHLLTFRYAEVENNLDILNVDYNMFESEMIPGPWYLPKPGLVVVRKMNSFQIYRLVSNKWIEYVVYVNEQECKEMLLGKFSGKEALLEAVIQDASGWKFISYKDSVWTVKPIDFPSEWKVPRSDVQVVTNLDAGYDMFVLRTDDGLRTYNINTSQQFECIVKCDFVKFPVDPNFDRIVFAKFSNAQYKDLLHFNSTGLNVYRFKSETKSYEPLYYSTKFSKFRNWNADHVSSIIIHDMDGDGYEELLFTGPSGLQVFKKAEDDEFYLKDVLLKSADDVHRFMALKTIIPKKANGMLSVVLYDDSKLLLVNVRDDTDTIDPIPEEEPNEKIQPQFSLITPAAKYTRWLHEQLDLSQLLQPVNSLTGKVELSIPLVQLDNPFGVSVHKIFQYRDLDGDRFLARGWCFPLDYITVDRRGSILEENFRYSIVKQRNQMALIPDFDLSTNEVLYFEVQNELVIKYFKKQERWEMESKEEAMRYIFGKYNSSEALQYMEQDKDKKFPIVWYLIREEDSSNSFVQYEYRIDGDNVLLTNIVTDLGSSVSFYYDNGQMHNITVKTNSYKQVVDLVYAEKVESKVFLTEIKQDNHTFFEFQYDTKSDKMVKIVYPNGLRSTLGYESLDMNRKDRNELKLIGGDFSVHYGPDYSVIVQTAADKSYALLEVRDLLGGLLTGKRFHHSLSTQDPLISYQVVTLENLFGIVLSFKTKKIAHLYQFSNNKWDRTERNLSMDAIVTANTKSLFVLDDNVLKTIELNDKGTLVVQRLAVPKKVVIHATYRGILLYNDTEFILRYSVENNHFQWRYEYPGLIQSMYETVDRFQLDEETRANLLRILKLDMVQFYNSCIILRTLEIDQSGNFIIRLKIHRLDKNHKLVQNDNWRVYLSRVENMSLEAKSAAGDTCIIRYLLKGNKYATDIKSCQGPTVREIDNDFYNELAHIESAGKDVDEIIEKAKSLVKYSNRMGAFEKKILEDNPFAFDVSLLGVSIDRDGIRTGGKIVSFNGTNWRQQNQIIGVDLTLRDTLKLRKFTSADDTYKIMEAEKVLFDSQTTDSSSVKLVWPHYFASQSKEGPPRLYLFDKNEIIQMEAHEKLSSFSNNLVVVTTDGGNANILLRPVASFLQTSLDVLSNQTLELNTNEHRITTYKHVDIALDPLSNAYVFNCSRIIPGGNETKFGWYEHRYDPKSRELSRIVSDGDGRYIKNIDPEIGGKHAKPNSTIVITDKAGRLQIVDIGPMNVTDGEFLYYGFETYERTLFGKQQTWKFADNLLVTENGNRFLKLKNSNDVFEGVLHMKRSNEMYIFSCWLKSNRVQNIGDTVKYVTATLEESDKPAAEIDKARIQQIVDDWYYIELPIKTKDLRNAITANLSIVATNQVSFHVDHLRFSPMSVDFKAYIYRQQYSIVSAVLHNNGLLTQYLLDPHGNRVVFVSESGKVTDFITYSKTYYIRASDTLPHVMEIRPRDGVVERFKDSSSENWNPINGTGWEMRNGYLIHKTAEKDLLKRTLSTKCDMFVVRFVYNLQTKDATIQLVVNESIIDVLCTSSQRACARGNVPEYGEIVVFVSKSHKAVWFEGTLIHEAAHSIPDLNEVGLSVSGLVKISEMLILYDPSIKITYYNRLGLPRQTLIMQDEQSVRIKEVLYDVIDRSIITTKWTTVKKSDNLLFGFHKNFITSVKSSKLEGLVDDLNLDCKGYPYFRKDYANNPTTVEAIISMPGETFSKDRKYARQLSRKSDIQILDVLFPSAAGFTQQVEVRQNASCHVMVSNAKNQKVAYYVQSDDFDRRMTTYEYDGDNLILELPPMYHSLAASYNRTKALWSDVKTAKDNQLQLQWGIRYTYNDQGQMVSKRMPDSGIQSYVYDEGVVRFVVHSDGNRTDKTVLLSYGATGKIVKEAIIDQPTELLNLSGNSTLSAESSNYVDYYHGEFDPSPNIRHRSQQSIRRIHDKQMIESLIFDNDDRIIKKVHVVPALNTSYSIDYEYLNDKLIMIRYPIDVNGSDFKLMYSYNNAGDMVSIGTVTNPVRFAQLQYNADGLVQEIKFEPGFNSAYNRKFDYNEPGYLQRIADMFLEEKVSYLEDDGYGSVYSMIFEGLISKTFFTAKWHQRSNPALSRLQLRKIDSINKTHAEYCMTRLQQQGYFDYNFVPLKSFYPKLDDTVSRVCRLKQLRKSFHANGFSKEYGHSYEYDSHEQLVKAKYFQSALEASWKPLMETTFASHIQAIDGDTSRELWTNLIASGVITQNCYNPGMCEGAPGNTSMLNDFIPKESQIQALLLNAIANVHSISLVNFEQKCGRWTQNAEHMECSETWKQLLAHNFVGAHSNKTQNALNPTFRNLLTPYSTLVPQIVQVLHQHFATRLGKSPGDVLSCRFDPNGNHRLFNRGFDRYQFIYKEGTNQISAMVKSDIDDSSNNTTYRMEHNSEGSVTVAEHKSIRKIEYDPLLNRPSRIEMTDGRVLKFEYDVRGERTFKQVLDKTGNIWKEKYYIRDLNRNVLVDVQLTFVAKDKSPDMQITSYVYSNRGLVGFIRNNEFYSVFADHEGSTRLVIKDGEVKAAYDYLPFGVFFRKAEEDLDGTISYLYTGQEWDEETGLYNYHTRLYDPEIGRFYQIDPKNQYPSPYVYAGNSPVTLVDPDGQFFMLLVAIALAIVGAYLGAAAANGSWNPAEWDWKSTNTWLGLLGGAIAGAALPSAVASTLTYLTATLGLSFSTSVSIMIGSGIGFTYFSMAAANSDWDPSGWDMKSPATWNAFFQGISTSVFVLKNPYNLVSSYNGISTYVGKGLFIGGKILLTTGFAYMFGVMQQNGEFDPSKWDFSKPGLYMSMFSGAMQATTTVTMVTNLPSSVKKWAEKISSALDRMDEIDAFLKYNRHLGADWSRKLSDATYFLQANSVNFNVAGKTALNVFLYTTVTSLRMSRIIEKNEVPEFGIMIQFISATNRIASFTDKFINELVPSGTSKYSAMLRNIPDNMEVPEYTVLSSGASKLFSSILDFIHFRFIKPEQAKTTCSDITNYTPTNTSTGRFFVIPNCYKLYDAESANSFVNCYGHMTKVLIHLDQPYDGIAEDTYRSCYPLSYNHIPSVSCEGEKSSLLFTVYDRPTMFDLVNGWILLARVMPTAVRTIVNGVRSVFGRKLHRTRTAQTDEVEMLAASLKGFNRLKEAIKTSTWAKQALEELNEDFVEFLDAPKKDFKAYAAFKERIVALQEDVLEELELHSSRMEGHLVNFKPKVQELNVLQPPSSQCSMHEIDLLTQDVGKMLQ